MKLFDPAKTKKASSIADRIFRKLVSGLKKKRFSTELDIYNFLRQKTYENGCRLAFRPVVAFGKNAAEIHHKANSTELKKGFLVVDFGVRYKGYCSDCTRTFYIYGRPSKKEKKLYNLVLLAQETALLNLRPDMCAADIDLIARNVLIDYYKNFFHGTGHGVGKYIHQAPSLKPSSRSIIRKGQTITVEPGLYFRDKLGIRIEDTVLVDEKPIMLTKIPKKLTVIT